jgi:hypothetical protein
MGMSRKWHGSGQWRSPWDVVKKTTTAAEAKTRKSFTGGGGRTAVIGCSALLAEGLRDHVEHDQEQERDVDARSGDADYPFLGAAVVPKLLLQLAFELSRRLELLDDVGAADQLSPDEDLRNRRPARER